MAHMDKGGCLYVPSLLDDELEIKVEKKTKRTRIYYNGIAAKKQQFYSEKAFRKLIDCSPELQFIIRKFGKVASHTELTIQSICDLVGASIL